MFCPPLCGVEFRGHTQYPAFSPGSSEVAVGVFFLVFLYLLVQNLPQLHMHAVIFSPIQFLCTVSPLHVNEFRSESAFLSPMCSLSPTKLA